jgi:2-keto-4-pentenoate hydratase/2-oxohepta-3-ene-1,7-dioic acid hydratase in catechol pathway
MRFIAYRDKAGSGLAIETKNGELRGRAGGSDLGVLVKGGADAIASAFRTLQDAPVLDPKAITYLPPFQAPPKIICVGLNYVDHAAESKMTPPTYPTLFTRFATSLVGHGQPIIRPLLSEKLDYEGELVAVIGTGGRYISKERALDHVAGYSIFNDGSIRDYQMKTPQWTVGKNFDGTGGFGPSFVTSDELPPGAAGLRLETKLNGQTVQSASTTDMIFDVRSLVSIISEAITLEAGDVIVSGTPAGVGAARKPPLWMKNGDICEISIEGLGTLRNPIADEPAR